MTLNQIIEESEPYGGECYTVMVRAYLEAYEKHKSIFGSYKELTGLDYTLKMFNREVYQMRAARESKLQYLLQRAIEPQSEE